MAYLKNTVVNLLNLHYGIHALVLSGAGSFYAVYLLRAGVPAPAIFAAFGLMLAGRFVIRPLVLVLALRLGLRTIVAFGTVVSAVQYLLLADVHGVDWMLLAVVAAGSVGDTFYWTSYHAYFAALGDAEHRGQQIGAREALAAFAAIIGPILCAWALEAVGPRVAFGAAAFVMAVAALPFYGTPDVTVKRDVPGAFRAALPGILMFVADGWTTIGFIIVWQIALFLSLGESYVAFGGAMALAGLVGAIGGLVLGRNIDMGHGGRAVLIAYGTYAVLILLRVLSTYDVALAVIANALGALVSGLYVPTLMTAVYNLAKRAPCTLRFHVATEGGWDLGGTSACMSAAVLSYTGAPLWAAILTALAGTAASYVLLTRYYTRSADALAAAPAVLS
jgi:MFS transporter